MNDTKVFGSNEHRCLVHGNVTAGTIISVQPRYGDQFVAEVISVEPIGAHTEHVRIGAKALRVHVPFAEAAMGRLETPMRVSFGTDQVSEIWAD